MSLDSTKGYNALRRGRYSMAGAEYFITFCTAERVPALTTNDIPRQILAECRAMQQDSVWQVRCGTVMPDHVHWLIELGPKLTLGQAVARLKARTAGPLRQAGCSWQAGYFDHRQRPAEDVLPYFHYTYLNPYRAKLLSADQEWPWFECEAADREWFLPLLNQGHPEPEWLGGLP